PDHVKELVDEREAGPPAPRGEGELEAEFELEELHRAVSEEADAGQGANAAYAQGEKATDRQLHPEVEPRQEALEPLRRGCGGEGDASSRLVVLAVGYLMVEDALDPLDDRPADEEGGGPRREQARSRRGREDVQGEESGRDVRTGRVADDAPEATLLQADAGH